MLDDLSDILSAYGFVFLSGYRPYQSTGEVSAALGTALTLPNVPNVHVLVPRRQEEAPPNIYSGNYGYGEFPLHTDLAHWYLPPQFIMLRCIQGKAGVSTLLLDGEDLIGDVGEDELRRTLTHPRRPTDWNRPLLRLIQNCNLLRILRWDSLFLEPVTANSERVFRQTSIYLREVQPMIFTLENRGDTLVFDNWRMLHGRSAVPAHMSDRLIERVYLGDLF